MHEIELKASENLEADLLVHCRFKGFNGIQTVGMSITQAEELLQKLVNWKLEKKEERDRSLLVNILGLNYE